jgi:hypothetical protein
MNTGCKRRCFLKAAVKAVAGVAFTGWAAALRAVPGQPATGAGEFTLIDAHTHFYDPTRPAGVPWPPRDDKLLYRRVLPPNHLALPVPKPVTGTVVVEAILGHSAPGTPATMRDAVVEGEVQGRAVCAGLAAGNDLRKHWCCLHCASLSVETQMRCIAPPVSKHKNRII